MKRIRLAAAAVLMAASAVALTAAADPGTGHGAMIARNHHHRHAPHLVLASGVKIAEKNGRGDCADVNTIAVGNPVKEHACANSRQFYWHQTGLDGGFPQGYWETYNGFPLADVNCADGATGGAIIVTTDTTQTGVVWDIYTDPTTGDSFITNRACSGGNGHWSKCMAWWNTLDSNLTTGLTAYPDGLYKAIVVFK